VRSSRSWFSLSSPAFGRTPLAREARRPLLRVKAVASADTQWGTSALGARDAGSIGICQSAMSASRFIASGIFSQE